MRLNRRPTKWFLRARDLVDMQAWIEALQKAIAEGVVASCRGGRSRLFTDEENKKVISVNSKTQLHPQPEHEQLAAMGLAGRFNSAPGMSRSATFAPASSHLGEVAW